MILAYDIKNLLKASPFSEFLLLASLIVIAALVGTCTIVTLIKSFSPHPLTKISRTNAVFTVPTLSVVTAQTTEAGALGNLEVASEGEREEGSFEMEMRKDEEVKRDYLA